MEDISLDQISAALAIIQKHHLSTPLVPFPGFPILLKAENLQPSGSFKIRGATYCLSLLSEAQKRAGVVTYSTGNHAQAVALAAKLLGIKATIVMSPDAPEFKIASTKALGGIVVMSEPTSKARRAMAEELTKTEGYTLIHAYDHVDVIAGQGSIGLEIMEAINPSTVFVPIGGGGLIAGIACAIKKLAPLVRMIGVEPELENDAYRSFKTGQLVKLSGPSDSIADAIKIQSLGDITFPLIQKYVDDIVTVTEEEIRAATLMTAEKAHLVVEPSGALALAAALKAPKLSEERPTICIASGGNISLNALCRLK